MFKLDGNPCYRPGAIWKTRTRIPSYVELNKGQKIVMVPKGEIIMLLGYIIRPNNEEHIQFLWRERVLFAVDVDAGLQFFIDPNGFNTQNPLLMKS